MSRILRVDASDASTISSPGTLARASCPMCGRADVKPDRQTMEWRINGHRSVRAASWYGRATVERELPSEAFGFPEAA